MLLTLDKKKRLPNVNVVVSDILIQKGFIFYIHLIVHTAKEKDRAYSGSSTQTFNYILNVTECHSEAWNEARLAAG